MEIQTKETGKKGIVWSNVLYRIGIIKTES